jgi:hypothetical protein
MVVVTLFMASSLDTLVEQQAAVEKIRGRAARPHGESGDGR